MGCVDLLDSAVVVIANIVTLMLLEQITKSIPDVDNRMCLRTSMNSSHDLQFTDGTTTRAAGKFF